MKAVVLAAVRATVTPWTVGLASAAGLVNAVFAGKLIGVLWFAAVIVADFLLQLSVVARDRDVSR